MSRHATSSANVNRTSGRKAPGSLSPSWQGEGEVKSILRQSNRERDSYENAFRRSVSSSNLTEEVTRTQSDTNSSLVGPRNDTPSHGERSDTGESTLRRSVSYSDLPKSPRPREREQATTIRSDINSSLVGLTDERPIQRIRSENSLSLLGTSLKKQAKEVHGDGLTTASAETNIIAGDEEKKSSRFHWWHAIFLFSLVCLFICLLQLFLPPPFGAMMTSAEVAEMGIAPGCEGGLTSCICPRITICATDTLSIVLLILARCSAFFDYPLYMMMFLSKAHNLNNHMRRTLFREFIDFGDMHKVHKIFGIVVGIETMSHSFFHMLRWGLNNDIALLWRTSTGITGMIAAFVTPLICWPMAVPYLKQHITFEVRKGLHYLSIVWAIVLLFHASSRIFYLIGIAALVYVLDYIYGYIMRNNLIETAYFERYGENGVALHFENPSNWEAKPKTSYVYIMCPWISKAQWHAFTIFPEPAKDNHTMLCIGTSGDWTRQLHEKIHMPCYRPLYVHGPYRSEFADTAVTTSNAIAVASGIGITPTLSLMLNYAERKRVNIIWMVSNFHFDYSIADSDVLSNHLIISNPASAVTQVLSSIFCIKLN